MVQPVLLNGKIQSDEVMNLSRRGRYILANRKGIFDIKTKSDHLLSAASEKLPAST